ncbi:hypothetical protein ACWD4N_46990 [Streptomyces sp. NPDC002586]
MSEDAEGDAFVVRVMRLYSRATPMRGHQLPRAIHARAGRTVVAAMVIRGVMTKVISSRIESRAWAC